VPAVAFASSGKARRKSAKSKGVPRAVFLGLLRIVPGGRISVALCPLGLHRAYPPCEALALGRRPLTGLTKPAYRPSETSARSRRARLDAAWTAGGQRRISDAAVSRPPLPAPRLETLIRHPSVTEAGCA
jgi:hypothetical protein